MYSTAQILDKYAQVTLDAATLATVPPLRTSMLELPAPKAGGPLWLNLELLGTTSTERTFTGAYWWGWSLESDKPVLIGIVNDGYDLTLSSGRGYAVTLPLVAGLYTHVGVTGTLAGDGLVLKGAGVEVQGD